jgi:hypothetical protein
MANPRDFHTPQPSYSKEDLLKSSEGGYFGPGNAQLPAPADADDGLHHRAQPGRRRIRQGP